MADGRDTMIGMGVSAPALGASSLRSSPPRVRVAGRGTRPATRAHIGGCPSHAGKKPQGAASTPTQHRGKAPEGSHNHSESTLILPSDCPTK